jgi:hypothetical protein
MPSSQSSRWDVDSSTDLSAGEPSVNAPAAFSERRKSGAVLRFTPHFSLIPYVDVLPLSAVEARVLRQMFCWAGKRGEGQGAAPDEGMFWRKLAVIAEHVRCSEKSVRLAMSRLRALGVLRWELVRPLQRLPSGARASVPVCVFFVRLDRFRQLVGLRVGTERARDGNHYRLETVKSGSEPPQKPAEIAASVGPATFSRSVNYLKELTITTREEPPPTNPQTDGGDRRDELVERLTRRWWERIGRLRIGGDEPRGAVVGQVGRAIAKALRESWSAEDIETTIDGRADRAIGGAAFDYCERTSSGVWEANLFGGCIPHFVRIARAIREREARTQKSLERREEHAKLEAQTPARRPADPGMVDYFRSLVPASLRDSDPTDAELAADADAFVASLGKATAP